MIPIRRACMDSFMEGTIWGSVIFALWGLFGMAGGLFNWDWFMTGRKARLISRVLGRTGARIFYVLLGLVLIALAIRIGIE
jgi:small neutral amino acid transporter SnatA (MarC family)